MFYWGGLEEVARIGSCRYFGTILECKPYQKYLQLFDDFIIKFTDIVYCCLWENSGTDIIK